METLLDKIEQKTKNSEKQISFADVTAFLNLVLDTMIENEHKNTNVVILESNVNTIKHMILTLKDLSRCCDLWRTKGNMEW